MEDGNICYFCLKERGCTELSNCKACSLTKDNCVCKSCTLNSKRATESK